MPSSTQASDKRQASLTSFFTPKAASTPRPRLPKTLSPPATHDDEEEDSPSIASRKRPLREDSENAVNGATRSPKRARSVALGEKDGEQIVEHSNFFSKSPVRAPRVKSPPRKAPANSARTERYVYDAALWSSRPGEGGEVSGDRQEGGSDEESPESRRRKEDLHKKFVKKLGHPDSMQQLRRRNWGNDGDLTLVEGGEDGEDGEEGEEEEEPQVKKPARKKGAKTGKLTPMELQMLEIKRQHPDTLLIVEVGYKFRFFGEDARIAAKELSIVCISGKFRYDEHPSEAHLDRFASASIPVHRLPVHAKRLVAAGHKVGVVRQLETAALKKVGDNRNAPFTRKLTNVYTKGTYVDELGELDATNENPATSPIGGYLLCITETKAKGWGTDEKVDVGLLAVQPATGDIIYDNFEDGFMRREIETRLLHISPCEFLIVGDLTKASEKLISHLAGSKDNVFGDKCRVERVAKGKTTAAEAHSHVTQFYADKLKDASSSQDGKASALLDKVLKLPELVTVCLSAMITHLKDYGLQHIFDLTKYFQPFSTRSHMLINGTTLESLEVYRNSTDHTEKGSLFWAIDKTYTKSGQRLLRKWVGMPLLDQVRLDERVEAVQELLEHSATPKVDKLETLLRGIKSDLERSLVRIYYGKCTRPELLGVLQTLQKISVEYASVKTVADTAFSSALIRDAICSIPRIGELVVAHLEKINPAAARRDDRYEFFREEQETEDISDHKIGIAAVEHELEEHREVAALKLGKKTPVSYATVAGIDYLIEVLNTDLKRVPASWMKISGTKKLSRFHTPEVVRMISERDQHKEALAAACDKAFSDLLKSIAVDYQPLRDAIASLATLDCLQSLAQVASLPGYTKPIFIPNTSPDKSSPPTTSISITEGRHPIAEHTLPGGYIPFTTHLSSRPAPAALDSPPSSLAQLITGPNMGGKSSYVRATSLLVLLAQIGSYVPATAMSLTLIDALHTRMGARDNLFKGESTFMVEVSETASILRSATPRSLVVLDELGRGTSTHDGCAIAHAVLEYIVKEKKCLTMFITHYQSLAKVAEGIGGGLLRNVHMRFTANKMARDGTLIDNGDGEGSAENGVGADHDGDEEITFLYEVGEGVAHRSYGLNVARLARIPRKVLDVAAVKSRQMEEESKRRQLRGTAALLDDVLNGRAEQMSHLITGIEQL